ncbi:ubiquitin carboxyl-terminal hydrolase CYLD-like isoform X2 [Protopterus annectens]|nr:ubiquitin carboxyl-terminal hydrolase CYLD-like isoform X2 [Protopterus annectens]
MSMASHFSKSAKVPKNCVFLINTDNVYSGCNVKRPGCLWYILDRDYEVAIKERSPNCLHVLALDDNGKQLIEVKNLYELSMKKALCLQAVPVLEMRVQLLKEGLLEEALMIEVDDAIEVETDRGWFPAIVKYIGSLGEDELGGTFFGVELQGDGLGQGRCNGTFGNKSYFKCKEKCGLFVPVSKIKRLSPKDVMQKKVSPSLHKKSREFPVQKGENVHFYNENNDLKSGLVLGVKEERDGRVFCTIATDGDDNFELPLEAIVTNALLSPGTEVDNKMDWQNSTAPHEAQLKEQSTEKQIEMFDSKIKTLESDLDVGHMVHIPAYHPKATGVIRWIGMLPERNVISAGIELDEDIGISDGKLMNKKYFNCPPTRGIFVNLSSCLPDSRFKMHAEELEETDGVKVKLIGRVAPLMNTEAVKILNGKMKGIQGHRNSCYMDCALFSLFSCSSVLDSMLFHPTDQTDQDIQFTLREEIVNPLRKHGYVDAKSIMKLRKQLTSRGHSLSYTTDEKDPEEFLNLIMHYILGIEPLLKLQLAAQKVQESYCYQIFMDKEEDLIVPTVQQLLEHSFVTGKLKLVEVPSCFIIQMPRFGKKYKMFGKIVPSLELDITDLLCDSPRECLICGDVATQECEACFKDRKTFSISGLKQYCEICCNRVHSHHNRQDHVPQKLQLPKEFHCRYSEKKPMVPKEKLELFAVLCIETSHYVSFVKYGPEKEHWMFFDSMADRHGDEDGYNVPTVILCPEVAQYLDCSVEELASQRPRDMEGVAKRLFCDAYMYMYQSTKMALYK